MRAPFILASCLLLAACATPSTQPPATEQQAALAPRYYDVSIPTPDGTVLRATVFQPALKAGEQAPLVMHTHGWGGFRVTGPEGFYGTEMMSGRAALAAWRNGYWVVSYDQRGWGNSQGSIMMMGADYEVKDASAVIDWAAAHLPRLVMDGPNDPRMGMVGESYGGAVQLLASAHDPRIDALVPIATWYDLAESMAPDRTLKIGWTGVLLNLGVTTSFKLGHFFQEPYLQSADGYMRTAVRNELQDNSMVNYCAKGLRPQADALLIQGMRDTLFPLNQAVAIRDCMEQEPKRDVRLLAMQGGHILPPPQQRWSGMPPFNNEPRLYCDGRPIDYNQAIVTWYDEKLRNRPGAASSLPKLCVSLDTHQGLTLEALPALQAPIDFNATAVRPLTSGWLSAASFVPLKTIDEPSDLIGAAQLQLNPRPAASPVLFASLAVKKIDGSIEVLNEQVTPLTGVPKVELAAVSRRLAPGEVLGLRLSGFSSQYWFNSSWSTELQTVQGQIRLPQLIKAQPLLSTR